MTKHGEGWSALHMLEEATRRWRTQSGRGDQEREDAVALGSRVQHKDQGYGRKHWVDGSIFWAVELRAPCRRMKARSLHWFKKLLDQAMEEKPPRIPAELQGRAMCQEPQLELESRYRPAAFCSCALMQLTAHTVPLAGIGAGWTSQIPLLRAPVCATGSGRAMGPVRCWLSEDGGRSSKRSRCHSLPQPIQRARRLQMASLGSDCAPIGSAGFPKKKLNENRTLCKERSAYICIVMS